MKISWIIVFIASFHVCIHGRADRLHVFIWYVYIQYIYPFQRWKPCPLWYTVSTYLSEVPTRRRRSNGVLRPLFNANNHASSCTGTSSRGKKKKKEYHGGREKKSIGWNIHCALVRNWGWGWGWEWEKKNTSETSK